MGVTGFYPWLKKIGYVPKNIQFKPGDTFLMDAKAYMYRYQFCSSVTREEFVPSLTKAIIESLSQFSPKNITFCNDGKDVPCLKAKTLARREQARKSHATKLTKLEQDK